MYNVLMSLHFKGATLNIAFYKLFYLLPGYVLKIILEFSLVIMLLDNNNYLYNLLT